MWGPDIKGCYQVKGVAAIKTSGKEYDEMKAMINEKNPALPARSLVIVKITEIFECKPGPTARGKNTLILFLYPILPTPECSYAVTCPLASAGREFFVIGRFFLIIPKDCVFVSPAREPEPGDMFTIL